MIASAAAWTTQGLVRMQDDRDRFAVRFTHLVCPGRSRRSPIRAVARERRCRCPPESRRTIVRAASLSPTVSSSCVGSSGSS
jgi:hypothetical protein